MTIERFANYETEGHFTSILTGDQQQAEMGGAPLEIDRDMHLCSDPAIGRADEGFNGRLLELAIWDESLSPETVAFFYQQVHSKTPFSSNARF